MYYGGVREIPRLEYFPLEPQCEGDDEKVLRVSNRVYESGNGWIGRANWGGRVRVRSRATGDG